ncbi:acyltransferase [Pseudoroseomonas wenyumeiae]|uniref:Acyltransferase n=1 Tax=Teichococcus wenyumeiae TaxID=2478470 RepID=A0A3A9J9W4_9PROT|nr:acyltransferase family protein [Pseudoroseomonas wenyumeiae]RKK01503.1 acyltransferase [Pseudoroseomonas wenyumeiae]RMI14759.1 acyltransferase [Pseudoroseomonas wenyumeiae]
MLIALVVVNHALLLTAEPAADYGHLDRALIVLTRAAVPALSLFSGYLFVGSTRSSLLGVARQKARTLILPFLAWNTGAVVVLVLLNETFKIVPEALVATQSRYDLVNDVTAFHGAPANAPLYFLRDLFITFMAFSLLRPVLRHPVGLALAMLAVVVNYGLDLDERIIIRNTIPVFFLMGFGLRTFPQLMVLCGRAVLPMAILSAALLPIWAFGNTHLGDPTVLDLATLTAFSILVIGLVIRLPNWPSLSALGKRYSFVIFLTHWWVLLGLAAVWDHFGWSDSYYRAFASLVAVGVGVLTANLISRLPGPIASALSGGRLKQPSHRFPTGGARPTHG